MKNAISKIWYRILAAIALLSFAAACYADNAKAIQTPVGGIGYEGFLDAAINLEDRDDYKSAIAALDEGIKQYPTSHKLYWERSYCKTELRDFKNAEADVKKCIELNPDYAFGYNQLGLIYKSQDMFREALKEFNAAVEKNPAKAIFYYNRGQTKFKLKDNKGTINDMNESLKLEPGDVDSIIKRGDAFNAMGDYNKAINDYTEAIKIDPKSGHAYSRRGVTKRNLGDSSGAITDFTKGIEVEPDFFWTYVCRGIMRKDARDFKGAIQDLNMAVKLEPELPESYFWRGIAKEGCGDKEGAKPDFKKALELKPNDSVYISYVLTTVTRLPLEDEEKQEATTQAVKNLSDRIKDNPKDVLVIFYRAITYLLVGNTEKAKEDMDTIGKILTGRQ